MSKKIKTDGEPPISEGAEVLFAFKVGDEVLAKNGLQGRIRVCGLLSDGIKYLVTGKYNEQWIPEDEIELSN